jgi:hypothetical protein
VSGVPIVLRTASTTAVVDSNAVGKENDVAGSMDPVALLGKPGGLG